MASRRPKLIAALAASTAVVLAPLVGTSWASAAPAASATAGTASTASTASQTGSSLGGPTLLPTARATASAGPAVSTPSSTPVSLTVVLTPADRTRLRALATTSVKEQPSTRLQRLDALAPTSSHRLRAMEALVDAGFHVSGSDPWNLTATGTVGQAEKLFGVNVVGTGDSMHPTTTPAIPASFGGTADAVLGLDQRPVLTPQVVPYGYGPADLTAAYSSSASATAGSGATIATVQFSGWDSSRLATYASAIGRPLPSITPVSVDHASPTTPDGYGGDDEVTLDQESLLATAPAAAQRIYFGQSTAKGIYDVYARVAADEAKTPITAVSTSWGSCEQDIDKSTLGSLEDVISRVVAQGATTFAASGDDGSSCPEQNNVSIVSTVYPASSPEVVAVGGTMLAKSKSGSFSETAWGDSSGASGGGLSASFARPSYQSSLKVSSRAVPDIAEVGAPDSGPGQFFGSSGGWFLGGGTSLSSPLAAGALASTLSARGCSLGVGDIHAALYANPTRFRDVTSGSNGKYKAGVGYDEVTGLGSPNWNALSSVLPTSGGCSTRTTTSTPPTSVGISTGGYAVSRPTTISGGYSLRSPYGQYELSVQTDGNVVEYGNGRALWATGTSARPGATLRLLSNGNLVVVDAGGAVRWQSGTSKYGSGVSLSITDAGDVRLVKAGKVIWHNGAPGANTLVPGATLASNQYLQSGSRKLIQQANGNLVLLSGSKATWNTKTTNHTGATFVFTSRGDLVVVNGDTLWHAATSKYGTSGMKLTMQSDGNLVLYKGTKAVWATHTH